jgi:uncharacterized protein YkwD
MPLRILLPLGFLLPASAFADAGGEPECEGDAGLTLAAAELLLEGRAPSPQQLDRAVREAGSDAVFVRAFFWQPTDPEPRAQLSDFRRKADAVIVCGSAQSERGRLVLATARAGWLDPLRPESTRVRGRLADSFSKPELVVQDGTGGLTRIALDREALRRGIPISPELARPALVQLLARGPAGPRPIAARVLPAVKDRPPSSEPASITDPASTLVEKVTALREHAGLRALRDNPLLQKVAQAHAARVCAENRVAHEIEAGRDPKQRLREAGIEARRVGETVASAQSLTAAFAAFERSPSHRLTLLEPGFTDVGTADATGPKGRRCVVVLLAAWPRYVGR